MSKKRRKGKARKRRGGKRRSIRDISTKHLEKYWFKSKGKRKRKGKQMAKRKRSHSRRKGGGARRSTRRRRHHSSGGGAGGRGLAAVKQDGKQLLLSGVYGLLEEQAKGDDSHVLNKLPKPIAQLGYTGNVALALYAATFVTGNPWVRLGARVVATIATYKLGRNKGAFADAKVISGDDEDYLGDERVIDENTMGALSAEGARRDSSAGVPFDDAVFDADGQV